MSPEEMLNECFMAVEDLCSERGLSVERIESDRQGSLGARLSGTTCAWDIFVDCNETELQLPELRLGSPQGLLAHVGYRGTICVNDGQGMSMDPDRHADIVGYTVLAGYELLEKSMEDANSGHIEFYNELEGYWLGLPGSRRGRATFDINGDDRLVTVHVQGKATPLNWYFTEFGKPLPSEFYVDKALSQRALYVHLAEVPAPPVIPDQLGVNYIQAIRDRLSSAQLELWARLVGSSKNSPKRVALLVSTPRGAGGLSLVGIAFGVRDGAIDANAQLIPLTVRRHSPAYMRERGGASLELQGKHIIVLGCGAVGSVVADSLASSGIGMLTLVDPEDFTEDNVFRHELDPLWIDVNKAQALEVVLTRRYPGIKVNGLPITAQEWLRGTDLSGIDGVVLALGMPTLERSFARAFRARHHCLPVVFTWLEPLDLGGHSVLMWTNAQGCLDCLYRDDEGQPALQPRTAFMEPNQPVSKNLTGCASVFVPYGALQARHTGLMAAEHMLAAVGGSTTSSYRNWVGEGRAAAEKGLRATPWRDIARKLSLAEATARVFGRPCKRCRGSA